MKIGNRTISEDDLFFWVEEGVASMGNLETALKYIQTAAEIGADGIEFQLVIPEEFYINSHPGFELCKEIQYTNNQIKQLIEFAKEKKICFFATVLSSSLVPILIEYDCDAFVINASDINNPGIIDPVIESKKPFFISLPLASEEEIEWIINRCKEKGAESFALMQGQHTMASGDHGVMPEDSNLGFISSLKSKYDLPVGYIDHSTSNAMPAIARAAGANFISKHLILNKADKGFDWFVCQDPQEMESTIIFTKKINHSLSLKRKILAPGEHLDKTIMRRSIVANDNIKKGTVICRGMLAFKRPGKGIPPSIYEELIGKKINRDIQKDEMLTFEMFE